MLLQNSMRSEDWTQFRGPTGQGVSQSRNLPTQWSETANVRWKQDIPGNGWSSPVVSNGRIYLTTAVPIGAESVAEESQFKRKSENGYSLNCLCLDAGSGELLWATETSQVPPNSSIHPKNSHASCTPVVTEDRIYVHFGTFGTAALDLDGNPIWTQQIKYQPVHGCGGSPVLYQNLLIFHCDGGDATFVIALDQDSGKERWRTPREIDDGRTFSFSTPLLIHVVGQPLLISPASDAVYGYDPANGEQRWVAQYPNRWSIVPRPVFADGLVLICTGYEGPAELLAIRPDGKGDVTESHIVWREDQFVPHNPSPIVHQGFVYLVSDKGIASCRELATGKLRWKERLGDDHSASPFLAGDTIYFLSEEGLCTIIRANPERYEEIAKNDLKQRTLASMVPLDEAILLRTGNALYRLQE
jgi:outer membrane protein assembly factor BamB